MAALLLAQNCLTIEVRRGHGTNEKVSAEENRANAGPSMSFDNHKFLTATVSSL